MMEIQIEEYQIYILDSVLEIMGNYKQTDRKSPEAGGVLLGQVKNNRVYIMKVSTPSIRDRSSRTSFIRNKKVAQSIIDYEFTNSKKKTIYLGEWHTHPEKHPKPSGVDLKMIFDQYKRNNLNEPFLLLIIQGTGGLYIGFVNNNGLTGININDQFHCKCKS
ncbi:hypothetical protein AWW67_07720 [Roseivirga seohaensis]|uniref:JAB domain-containing protein n=1 Tax=Roseivirga seohaensis TaxID=1914963 RepID=A0A150XR88_9BACT|nr:Mov34/MPN/PAD-1 family protein [Roseivirga seohaensis]KYG81236.1 hypothetical protein AWW67_07720 [Roseivirga seohaensis]